MNLSGFPNETRICQVSETCGKVRFEIGVVTLDALLVANHPKFITGNLSRMVTHILVFGMGWSQARVLVPVGPCSPLVFQDLQKNKKNLKSGVFETPFTIQCIHQWISAIHIFGLIFFCGLKFVPKKC